MSLETLSVKEEAEEGCDNEETGARVKKEAECEDSAGLCELYADHQIKDELVLGPVELHRPCVASTLPAPLVRAGQALGRACSVRLSRLLVAAARRSCRVGRRTDTLRRTREPRDWGDTCQCDHCGRTFYNKALLRKHIHTHLPTLSHSTREEFACYLCDYKFKTKLLVLQHERNKHGVISSMSTVGHRNSYRSHIVKKLLNCNHCSYFTVNMYHFQHHLMTHTGEKPFKCSHCNYKCRQQVNLQIHERIHTGEKPFKCSHCDYKCARKSNLQEHERIHTGEKPFKCSHCVFSCARKSSLQEHERIHTGEKPFKCSYCDYEARRKGTLVIHERTHTHCDELHTGEKPFKCNHCDYSCARKSSLQEHERIHTAEKPFKCSYCDYEARRKGTLVRHERTHTHCDEFVN